MRHKTEAQDWGAQDQRGIGRREVLKAGAIGLVATGVGAAALTDVGASTEAKRFAMVIDVRKCIGCHACQVACKSENQVPLGVWRSWVKEVERGRFPNTQRHFLPRLCNHCERPACVEACPTRASYKRKDGIVLILKDRCIGCKLCIAACPYDARFVHPDRKTAEKCTFCVHRVDNGVAPSCVNTCQGGARIFGDLNDPTSEVARLVSRESVQVLKPELGTRPCVFYIGADTGLMRFMRKEI